MHHIKRAVLVIVSALAFSGLLLDALSHADVAASAIPQRPVVQLVRSDEHGVVFDVDVPSYTIGSLRPSAGSFASLSAPGLDMTNEPGKPQLPQTSVLLGVPPDARVEIHVLRDDVEALTGHFNLAPSPSSAFITADLQPGSLVYAADAAAYASSALYPAQVARLADDAWMRDQRVVRVEIHPFQVTPATGAVLWHRHLQVEVRFYSFGPPTVAKVDTTPDPFDLILSNALLNYGASRAWRSPDLNLLSSPAQVFDSTPRYKIVVDHDGFYRLTYADLQAAGMDVANIDPGTFHLTSQGRDVAIVVNGETDGHFDPGDSITFYGQKFFGGFLASQYAGESASWLTFSNGWHPQYNATMMEKYTDDNVYWLTVGGAPGPRMAAVDGSSSGLAPVATYYTATAHAEQSSRWLTWHFTSEDTWFWEEVTASSITTRTYTTTLSALASTPVSATVRGEAVAVAYNNFASPDHRAQFWLNGAATPLEDATWDGPGPTRHHFEARVSQSDLSEGQNQLEFVVIRQPALTSDDMYFDWFEIEYARRFQAEDDQLLFSTGMTGAHRYDVGGFLTDAIEAYNVTDPFLPQQVLSTSVNTAGGTYTTSFEISSTMPVTYFVVGNTALQTPKSVTRYVPPDLQSPTNGADYIMITPLDFYTETLTLAQYRASQGLRVKVVNVDDLYNEFDYGIYNPIAIKNFLKYAYANWQPPAPSYVLLVGDGHWNFKGFNIPRYTDPPIYMPPNLAWVDPWQGEVDSANLLAAIAGDDILPDLAIGRLPVNTVAELNAAISKIIAYEQTPPQAWQRHLLFVADNVPDPKGAGDFVAMSDGVISGYVPSGLQADRIYLNSYCPPQSAPCPAVNYAITTTLNVTGVLLANYVGHAGIGRWADESVFVNNNISTLTNGNQLPVILSMTCLDGYWIYPNQPSLIESLIRASDKGAVTTFSPTGLGVATGHDALQRGFYTAVFSDGIQRIGPATIAAKLALYATGSNYDLINTFTIFGDPALRLPTYAIDLTPTAAAHAGLVGTTVTYTLRVTNEAYLTDSLALSVNGNSWPTSLSAVSLTLPAGLSADVGVSVTIPETATAGRSDVVTVTVNSHGDSTMARSWLTTTAYGLSLTAIPSSQLGSAGSTVAYLAQVVNNSDVSATVEMSRTGNVWPVSLSSSGLTLAPWDMADVAVSVTIPSTAAVGSSDVVTLMALMQEGGTGVSVRLTTTANAIYGLDLMPRTAMSSGDPGSTVTYTLAVTNSGYPTPLLVVSGTGNTWPVSISPAGLSLPVGNSAHVDVSVTVPVSALAAQTDLMTVTVSDGDAVIGFARLTTAANAVYGLGLKAAPEAQVGEPDATVTYTVQITNTGNITDDYDLGYAGNVWPVDLSVSHVTLSPGAMAGVIVSNTIDAAAPAGVSDMFTVTAASHDHGVSASAHLTSTAGAVYSLDLAPHTAQQLGEAGQPVTYTLRMTNTGNITSTFAITVTGNAWPTIAVPGALEALAPGSSADMAVVVAVPSTASSGMTDTANIEVQGEATSSATAVLTTIAGPRRVFLPVVLK